jgi:hypothetical protein
MLYFIVITILFQLLTCAGCSTASKYTERGEEEFSGCHSSINTRYGSLR